MAKALETTARCNTSYNHGHQCDCINNHGPKLPSSDPDCHHRKDASHISSTNVATNVMMLIITSKHFHYSAVYHKLTVPCPIPPHDHHQYLCNTDIPAQQVTPLSTFKAQPALTATTALA